MAIIGILLTVLIFWGGKDFIKGLIEEYNKKKGL